MILKTASAFQDRLSLVSVAGPPNLVVRGAQPEIRAYGVGRKGVVEWRVSNKISLPDGSGTRGPSKKVIRAIGGRTMD